MRRFLFLMVLSVLCTISIFAQKTEYKITGRIWDAELKEPVMQASVQLLTLPDSAYKRGVASGMDGKFSLTKLPVGRYLLKISYVGFRTKLVPVNLVDGRNKELGDVVLEPDAIMLSETVITAVTPPVVAKADTIEYSASAYPVPEGSMLEDLIKKIPGVEIDDNGTITLNGKEIKKIMVDGKEFFSDDPQMSMKNLPANIVNKVRAYEKQSDQARYTGIDDGEEEPVLDLSIKEGMKQGWIGNLIAGYGSEDRYEAGGMISRFKDDSSIAIIGSANNTNSRGFSEFGDAGEGLGSRGWGGGGLTTAQSLGLNYAKEAEKYKVEGNVQYGHSDRDSRTRVSSETFLGDESSFGESSSTSLRNRHDVRMDVRLEWRPDTMTTIVFRPNASYSHTNTLNDSWSQTDNNDHNPINSMSSNSSSKGHNVSFNGNLMFFRRLNNKGRNIHVGARFGYSDNEYASDSYSESYFYALDGISTADPDSTSLLQRHTDRNGDSRNWSVTASYTEPVFKNHFLQFRYQFAHRKQLSQSLVYDSINYPDRINLDYDNDLSSRVENFYDTHTAEISFRGVYPKLLYNVGLSLTPQSSLSKTTIGPNYKRNLPAQHVLNWAPSLRFRYRFDDRHELQIRYNGRSSEPSISDLQEVIDITDPMNMRYGNPSLKPSFTNNVRVEYNRFILEKMSNYRVFFNFSNTSNSVVDRMTYNPETGGRIYRRENVNGNWSANTFLAYNTPLRNQSFTIDANAFLRYSNNKSYTSVGDVTAEQVLSTTRSLNANYSLRGAYRCDEFDVSLYGRVGQNVVRNNKQANSNRKTQDYRVGMDGSVYLPWDISVSTDFYALFRNGYSDDLNSNEFMWNAQISKSFLKNKAAMIRVKIYDILQQQSSLSRSISGTMMSDTETNTLGSYFMVHFVYRFNTLGKGARGNGDRPGRGGPGRGGFGGGRPPMGGGRF